MVVKRVQAAATAVADFIRGGPRVDHRELLIVTKKRGEWLVIEPPHSILEKSERVKMSALSTLRPALPWINGMNLIDKKGSPRFVDHHIEYDVVEVAFCDMLGLPKGVTPTAALKQHGFKLIPLENHRFANDIKRVLEI